MSALTKPLTKFSTSLTPNAVVAVEHLSAVEKVNIPAGAGRPAKEAKYYINFNYQYPGGSYKEVKIPFLTSVLRDNALNAFQVNNTVTI